MTTTLWIVAVLLIIVGVAGTVLPALPGVPLIFGGVLLAAWIGDFQRISVFTVVVLAVLAVIGIVIDYVAAAISAKRAGASKARNHRRSNRHGCGRLHRAVGAAVHAACGRGSRRIHRAQRCVSRWKSWRSDMVRAADRHRNETGHRVHDDRRLCRRIADLTAQHLSAYVLSELFEANRVGNNVRHVSANSSFESRRSSSAAQRRR